MTIDVIFRIVLEVSVGMLVFLVTGYVVLAPIATGVTFFILQTMDR